MQLFSFPSRFPAWGFPVAVITTFANIYFFPSLIDLELFIFEKPPPALVGSLQVNKKLQSGQRIFTGQLKGPESFTVDDEVISTLVPWMGNCGSSVVTSCISLPKWARICLNVKLQILQIKNQCVAGLMEPEWIRMAT
ncbi:uncharacterized protein [Apteryx mantelli]|uniref:Uncharacterized protein isoform X1 n=1 Tax=Apteryx mantelli TaxID=2696672 RepID=A0ABM4FYV0_9AVES